MRVSIVKGGKSGGKKDIKNPDKNEYHSIERTESMTTVHAGFLQLIFKMAHSRR